MIFPLSYAAALYPETAVYVGGFGIFFAGDWLVKLEFVVLFYIEFNFAWDC